MTIKKKKSHLLLDRYAPIAKEIGLTYCLVTQSPTVNYDGNGVSYFVIGDDDMFAHELAHYLVATPIERKMINFGLGSGPSDQVRDYNLKGHESERDADNDIEAWASLLGILIQRYHGEDFFTTMVNHNWTDVHGIEDLSVEEFRARYKTIKRTYSVLVRDGFVVRKNGKFIPAILA